MTKKTRKPFGAEVEFGLVEEGQVFRAPSGGVDPYVIRMQREGLETVDRIWGGSKNGYED